MKKIVVASNNPAKLQAALNGFKKLFPHEEFIAEGVSVGSGVSDQPTDDAETYQGAYNRAINARKAAPGADFWVGMEGGIESKNQEMEAYAWMVVLDKAGRVGKGRTGVFFLPPRIVELIKSGKELGEADDIVFGSTDSKRNSGAIGLLTDDVIDRAAYYTDAVIFALIPFKNTELYPI